MMNNQMESKSSQLAKDLLAANDDWTIAALQLLDAAKRDPGLLGEIVQPIIGDRIWQAIERLTPINVNGGSLLTSTLSTVPERLLGDAGKTELAKEIGFLKERTRVNLETVGWDRFIRQELEEKETIRQKFTDETLMELREKFNKQWTGALVLDSKEPSNHIRTLASEALYQNRGDWILAMQSLTQRVMSDSQSLFYLTIPVFFTMVWPIFLSVTTKRREMKPPMDVAMSTGWIFGDASHYELDQEILFWEEGARFYLRKARWFESIVEAIDDSERVDKKFNDSQLKELWNEAYIAYK